MSRKNAIRPLAEKLSDAQMARRLTRISGRQTVADQLMKGLNLQGAVLKGHHDIFRRGFFGRLKWVLFGR